jgi:tetratricopeptide (TPR) repeat protein
MNAEKRDLVFLSYASEDLKMIWQVYEGLLKRKLRVWFDKKDLKPGEWKPQIIKAIARSRFFVICISEAALRKTGDKPGFQDKELNTAYQIAQAQPEQEFTIVPTRLEDCDRGDFRLSSFQQYDLFPNIGAGLDELAVDLGGISLSDANARDVRTEDEKLVAGLMGKAEAAFYAGEHEKVVVILDSVLSIEPNSFAAWRNKGAALGRLGNYKKALAAYEKALEIKPNNVNAWFGKGLALANLEHHKEALAAYEKALELNGNYVEAWNNKGATLGRLNRYEEALAACHKALELKPDYADAWLNKGTALRKLGRDDEALAACNKALEIRPDLQAALRLKEELLRTLKKK